jgi:uncharacterized membrane protein YwaF
MSHWVGQWVFVADIGAFLLVVKSGFDCLQLNTFEFEFLLCLFWILNCSIPVMCIFRLLWFVNKFAPCVLWLVPLLVDYGPWCLAGAGVLSLDVYNGKAGFRSFEC